MQQQSAYILSQLQSDDILSQKSAIEAGLKHPDQFVQQTTIDSALRSGNKALQSRALQASFLNLSNFGGYVCGEDEEISIGGCSGTFMFNIVDSKSSGSSVVFNGNFAGTFFLDVHILAGQHSV